jgi:hypothetical protein
MKDYTKDLEQQNEQLRKKLEEAQIDKEELALTKKRYEYLKEWATANTKVKVDDLFMDEYIEELEILAQGDDKRYTELKMRQRSRKIKQFKAKLFQVGLAKEDLAKDVAEDHIRESLSYDDKPIGGFHGDD